MCCFGFYVVFFREDVRSEGPASQGTPWSLDKGAPRCPNNLKRGRYEEIQQVSSKKSLLPLSLTLTAHKTKMNVAMLTYSLVWYTKTRKLFNISFMPSCSSQLWLQREKKVWKGHTTLLRRTCPFKRRVSGWWDQRWLLPFFFTLVTIWILKMIP